MLSKKAKYAIEALLRLADHQHGEPMRIADLARAEQIPPKFLEFTAWLREQRCSSKPYN